MKFYDKEQLENYLNGRRKEGDRELFGEWITGKLPNSNAGDLESELIKFWGKSLATARGEKQQTDRAFESLLRRLCGRTQRSLWNRSLRIIYRSSVAATIALLIVLSGYLMLNLKNTDDINWVEVYTINGETKQVVLPDSSTIWLKAGTHIVYPEKYTHIRKVFISGEAFIDVQKDKNRPFVVDTRNVSIRVHGTRFNIRSYADDDNTETSLLEGSISLAIKGNKSTDELFVVPGERVIVDNRSNRVSIEKFDIDTYASWREGQFTFKDATLAKITRELERVFDVQIVIRDSRLLQDTYFVTFAKGLSLDQMLNALNVNRGLEIKRDGRIIEINKR